MKTILLAVFILFNLSGLAQNDTMPKKLPPFMQLPEVPSYKILLMDSSTFAYKYQLKKNRPVVVIWFNPDCEHCQQETKWITDSMKLLKNIQFIFASYSKFEELKKFYNEYGLSKFENIIYGRDVQYQLPRFYELKYTPYVAAYDKDWKLIRVFEGGTTVEKLAALF